MITLLKNFIGEQMTVNRAEQRMQVKHLKKINAKVYGKQNVKA